MSQILQPGGGVLLLPFVKIVVGLLLLTTLTVFAAGVARIHMAILSFLSAGLLFSLSMFEVEYKKAQEGREGPPDENEDEPAPTYGSTFKAEKTD
jgi:hypothetical protein